MYKNPKKRKKIEHHSVCECAICNDDPNPNNKNEAKWWPGESVCQRKPHKEYQNIQKRINEAFKEGRFQDLEEPFTANELEASTL